MPTLNNVIMWSPEHGWQSATAQQALAKHPWGLTYHSHQFFCTLCYQYVQLISGSTPHFKHHYRSHDCEEKAMAISRYYATNPLGLSLPLKINLSQGGIEVLIGFLPVPQGWLSRAEVANDVLLIYSGSGDLIRKYKVTNERFSRDHITYLSVGHVLSRHYILQCKSIRDDFWPKNVPGIEESGTLFDAESKKRLPKNADVVVGREYLLLSKHYVGEQPDVSVRHYQSVGAWQIYHICATRLSHNASTFFLEYNAFLSESPVSLTHLWPPALRSSHFLLYNTAKVWFHKTDGYLEVYPSRKILGKASRIFAVERSDFEQMISIRRFENHASVLRYTLLRHVPSIDIMPQQSPIFVVDEDGNPVAFSELSALPPRRTLQILARYDGFIDVIRSGITAERISVSGGAMQTVEMSPSTLYRFYIGLDFVGAIVCNRVTTNEVSCTDSEIALRLRRFRGNAIAIPHSAGVLAVKLTQHPKTKLWLLKQIRAGTISETAYSWLKKRLGGGSSNV